jgi:competence protein ComEA
MDEFNLSHEQKRGLLFILAVIVGLAGFYFFNSRPADENLAQSIQAPLPIESKAEILIVNVAGKVSNPGVYQLPQGSRVIDAIAAAGNQLKGVDLSEINLARLLVDGEQIYVGPSKNPGMRSKPKKITIENPLDINKATMAQLDTLPGIGPVTAQRILDYRAKVGRINAVDELKKISGLGGSKFEEIKALLRVL